MSWTNFDRSLLIHQAYNGAISRKLDQEILNQVYYQNQELQELNQQVSKINILQNKFLELQIEEIKKRERNKFLKNFAFQISEMFNVISQIKDKYLSLYFLRKYSKHIKEHLIFVKVT